MFTIDLTGRTALVAGVANHRSLAWGIAQDLSAAGARLALTYQGERLKENVEKLSADLPGTILAPCDVSDDAQIEDAVATVAQAVGPIHMFVHSIAFATAEDLAGKMSGTTRAGFRAAMETSAYSFVALARAVRPHMPAGGSMLTISFLAAERVFPNYNVLGAAKAALEHHVRQLASEFGPDGIRANAISAGAVKTLASAGISGFSGAYSLYREKSPLRRNITKEDVGHAALFLLSDLASGITGETLHVDGGYHIVGG